MSATIKSASRAFKAAVSRTAPDRRPTRTTTPSGSRKPVQRPVTAFEIGSPELSNDASPDYPIPQQVFPGKQEILYWPIEENTSPQTKSIELHSVGRLCEEVLRFVPCLDAQNDKVSSARSGTPRNRNDRIISQEFSSVGLKVDYGPGTDSPLHQWYILSERSPCLVIPSDIEGQLEPIHIHYNHCKETAVDDMPTVTQAGLIMESVPAAVVACTRYGFQQLLASQKLLNAAALDNAEAVRYGMAALTPEKGAAAFYEPVQCFQQILITLLDVLLSSLLPYESVPQSIRQPYSHTHRVTPTRPLRRRSRKRKDDIPRLSWRNGSSVLGPQDARRSSKWETYYFEPDAILPCLTEQVLLAGDGLLPVWDASMYLRLGLAQTIASQRPLAIAAYRIADDILIKVGKSIPTTVLPLLSCEVLQGITFEARAKSALRNIGTTTLRSNTRSNCDRDDDACTATSNENTDPHDTNFRSINSSYLRPLKNRYFLVRFLMIKEYLSLRDYGTSLCLADSWKKEVVAETHINGNTEDMKLALNKYHQIRGICLLSHGRTFYEKSHRRVQLMLQAREEFEKATKLIDYDFKSFYLLALAALEQRDIATALTSIQIALALYDGEAALWALFASILSAGGESTVELKLAESTTVLLEALQVFPGDALLLGMLITAQAQLSPNYNSLKSFWRNPDKKAPKDIDTYRAALRGKVMEIGASKPLNIEIDTARQHYSTKRCHTLADDPFASWIMSIVNSVVGSTLGLQMNGSSDSHLVLPYLADLATTVEFEELLKSTLRYSAPRNDVANRGSSAWQPSKEYERGTALQDKSAFEKQCDTVLEKISFGAALKKVTSLNTVLEGSSTDAARSEALQASSLVKKSRKTVPGIGLITGEPVFYLPALLNYAAVLMIDLGQFDIASQLLCLERPMLSIYEKFHQVALEEWIQYDVSLFRLEVAKTIALYSGRGIIPIEVLTQLFTRSSDLYLREPNNVEILKLRAAILLQFRDPIGALELLDLALVIAIRDVQVHELRAIAFELMGDDIERLRSRLLIAQLQNTEPLLPFGHLPLCI